jgi:hypothetical protein
MKKKENNFTLAAEAPKEISNFEKVINLQNLCENFHKEQSNQDLLTMKVLLEQMNKTLNEIEIHLKNLEDRFV